jgi:UDP-N-acetylglucosamine 1-carboxyvinyltransferase
MDKLVVTGGQPLTGSLTVGGSKNTALPLMAASLLADGTSTLTNIPALRDVYTFSNVLRVSGASVSFDESAHQLTVDAGRIDHPEAPYDLVKKMRASFYMLGALWALRPGPRVATRRLRLGAASGGPSP